MDYAQNLRGHLSDGDWILMLALYCGVIYVFFLELQVHGNLWMYVLY